MKEGDFIYLGKIIKNHGFKGDWVVYFEFPDLTIYKDLNSLFIEIEGSKVPFLVENFRSLPKKNKFLIKFEQSHTLDQGFDLKDLELFFPVKLLSSKDKQNFRYHYLLGFSVKEIQKGDLGEIKSIDMKAFQPLILVDYKEKELLIPLVDVFIKEINKKQNYILMDLPEGLLDLS